MHFLKIDNLSFFYYCFCHYYANSGSFLFKVYARKLDYWVKALESSPPKTLDVTMSLVSPTLDKIKITPVLVVEILHHNTGDTCGVHVTHQGHVRAICVECMYTSSK